MSSVTFLGDVWLPLVVRNTVRFDGEFVFNLESPITSATQPIPGKLCLQAIQNYIRQSFGRNPLAVCLANNHIMDLGVQGFSDTVAELRQEGIRYFGAGTKKENCNNPLVVRVSNTSVGFLGYVCPTTNPIFAMDDFPGVMPIELRRIRDDVRLLRERGVERVVVMLHWGMEQVDLPRMEDGKMAGEIIGFGVDLIVGHHSHTIHPIQFVGKKAICFGLGNCIFPSFSIPVVRQSGLAIARYKQRSWNRRSLAVTVEMQSMRTKVEGVEFRKGILHPLTIKPNVLKESAFTNPDEMQAYQKRFARHLRFTKMRSLYASYRTEPRIPFRRYLSGLFAKLSLGPVDETEP